MLRAGGGGHEAHTHTHTHTRSLATHARRRIAMYAHRVACTHARRMQNRDVCPQSRMHARMRTHARCSGSDGESGLPPHQGESSSSLVLTRYMCARVWPRPHTELHTRARAQTDGRDTLLPGPIMWLKPHPRVHARALHARNARNARTHACTHAHARAHARTHQTNHRDFLGRPELQFRRIRFFGLFVNRVHRGVTLPMGLVGVLVRATCVRIRIRRS